MAGTTTSSTRSTGRTDDVSDVVRQHNKAVDDLELVRQTGVACVFSSVALAIKAGGSALVKAVNAVRYVAGAAVGGAVAYGLSTANLDMAALVGTVTNAKFNVFVFSWADDGAGTRTVKSYMGTEGATRGAVVFPNVPNNEAIVGFVEINPTGTGNFVGGTTALDDATVVPNAAYVNFIGVPVLNATKAASGLTAAKIGDRAGTAIS